MKKQCSNVKCADGFTMSVQASKSHYSEPQNDEGPYTSVEVGYPSEYDHLLRPYQDGDFDVYGYVPVHVVQMVIDARGGIVEGELPPFRFDPSLCGMFMRPNSIKE